MGKSNPKASLLQPWLIIPDTHVPYHDTRAFGLMLRVAESMKPHGIILLGDFCDFYAVSSHSKAPRRGTELEWEIKEVNAKLTLLDNLGAKKKIYIEGNHEDRLLRYLQNVAPALFDVITVPALFNLQARGWHHVPYKSDYALGKMNFTHDVGSAGRYSVYRCLDTYQHSNATGHTHRLAYIVEGNAKGEHKVSAQFGWLGDVNQVDYMHKATAKKNWVPGFGVMYYNPKTEYGYITPVPIVDYTVCFNGKLFKG